MEDRRFCCTWEDCGSKFKRGEHLKFHLRSHTQERPFPCTFAGCTWAFSSKPQLTVHERTHSNDRPYVCRADDTCRGSFRTPGSRTWHERTHGAARAFVCTFAGCGASFHQSNNLRVHERSHQGIRPYHCPFQNCGASFTQKSNLTGHKRIHEAIKKFKCDFDECPYECNFAHNLASHKITHSDERPFLCDVDECGMTFRRQENLKAHNYFWHTKEGQVRKKKDERRILRLLQASGVHFKEQHVVDFVCLGSDRDGDRCFVDFLIEVKDDKGHTKGFVFLEVDEGQHKWYSLSCELRRMTDVHRSLVKEGNTFPVIFIRYNPGPYKVDEVEQKKTLRAREEQLMSYIQNLTFNRPFSVAYMFYDTTGSDPHIFAEPDYAASFKAFVVDTIV
jgi:hypothetical protein